jgi:hypothetical protein
MKHQQTKLKVGSLFIIGLLWIKGMKPQMHRNRSDGKWCLPFEITEDVGNTPERFAPHARTPAVAYRLDAGQRATLDACEGTPENYLRLAIVFTATDGTRELMQAYLAHPDKLLAPYRPRSPQAGYLAHILRGYRHWGLDEDALPWVG